MGITNPTARRCSGQNTSVHHQQSHESSSELRTSVLSEHRYRRATTGVYRRAKTGVFRRAKTGMYRRAKIGVYRRATPSGMYRRAKGCVYRRAKTSMYRRAKTSMYRRAKTSVYRRAKGLSTEGPRLACTEGPKAVCTVQVSQPPQAVQQALTLCDCSNNLTCAGRGGVKLYNKVDSQRSSFITWG